MTNNLYVTHLYYPLIFTDFSVWNKLLKILSYQKFSVTQHQLIIFSSSSFYLVRLIKLCLRQKLLTVGCATDDDFRVPFSHQFRRIATPDWMNTPLATLSVLIFKQETCGGQFWKSHHVSASLCKKVRF